MRQLNFSSFGTQLETPAAAAVLPPCGARRRSAMGPPRPRPGRPHRPSRIQEGPTAIDPDLHAPNERDCQRKPTCRTRTCGNAVLRCPSRTPWTPPSSSRPAAAAATTAYVFSLVSSILPRRSTAPPALPSSFSYSPNLPNRATARLKLPDSLFSLPSPSRVPPDSRGSTRAALKDEGPAGHVGGIAKRSWV